MSGVGVQGWAFGGHNAAVAEMRAECSGGIAPTLAELREFLRGWRQMRRGVVVQRCRVRGCVDGQGPDWDGPGSVASLDKGENMSHLCVGMTALAIVWSLGCRGPKPE